MGKIEAGNIITTTDDKQLLVTKTYLKGVRAISKRIHGSKIHFIQNRFIAEVQYLHGDRFSYELRQQWK